MAERIFIIRDWPQFQMLLHVGRRERIETELLQAEVRESDIAAMRAENEMLRAGLDRLIGKVTDLEGKALECLKEQTGGPA